MRLPLLCTALGFLLLSLYAITIPVMDELKSFCCGFIAEGTAGRKKMKL